MKTKNNQHKLETKLIHSGEPRPGIMGAVSLPVFQSSTYEYSGEVGYHAIRYVRLNNTPNHLALNEKLADLENAESAMVTSSGMAAISTALLTVLKKGDHLLAQNVLYGGTYDFVTKDLPLYGIEYDLIDAESPETWKSKLKKNTKAVYVESITNPLVQVADLKAAVRFAREHGVISMIDNTFTSPVNYRPAEHGYDLSLHSCTKYMNGHNDIAAGAVIGKEKLVEKFSHKL
jgi:cystathionine beta-lyase/cystathionine gamma-synthase